MSSARAHPDVLDELAALGPFFAVEAHHPGPVAELPWRPFADVITPAVLLGRIGKVRSALTARSGDPATDVDQRVAASVTQLGLMARVVAPALAALTLGQPLDLRPDGLWWQDTLGGPLPLSVPAPAAGAPSGPSAPSGDQIGALIGQVITPVTVATAAMAPVSGRVLWGNVASAINGAARQVARGRPDLAPAAWAVAAAFFRRPELGTEPGPPGPAFRRASCCLIYRLAPGRTGAICGDCVLNDRHR